jgi:hypothetical protein
MYAKKILLKSDHFLLFFFKYGFDLWPRLSHNVTTLDNDNIDISMSHILLFPKIYNLAVCHTIKANQQKSIPCYPTIRETSRFVNLRGSCFPRGLAQGKTTPRGLTNLDVLLYFCQCFIGYLPCGGKLCCSAGNNRVVSR